MVASPLRFAQPHSPAHRVGIDTLKDRFSLKRHGGCVPDGVWARVCLRILALPAGCWHNWQIGEPGWGFTGLTIYSTSTI